MSIRHAERLANVHPELCGIVTIIGIDRDIDIVAGARSLEDEEQAIAMGRSHLKSAAHSKHVLIPGVRDVADAVDVTPHPVNWMDIPAFITLGHAFKQVAAEQNVNLTWGGDFGGVPDKGWDMDHFERTTT